MVYNYAVIDNYTIILYLIYTGGEVLSSIYDIKYA